MSDIHAVRNNQLFASPGVVIRKCVVLKPSRYQTDEYSKSSTAGSHLPFAEDTTHHQSLTQSACQPVISSSEGTVPSSGGLDENGNPVENAVDMVADSADVRLTSSTADSRTSVESGFVFPAQSNVRQSFNERRRSNKHASNCAFSRRRTKTTELSSAGMSSVRQSLSHFELTTAQIFLYDAYQEVLHLKSHGLQNRPVYYMSKVILNARALLDFKRKIGMLRYSCGHPCKVWQKSTVLSGERVLSLFGVTETFQTSVPAAAAAVYDIGVAGIISQP